MLKKHGTRKVPYEQLEPNPIPKCLSKSIELDKTFLNTSPLLSR